MADHAAVVKRILRDNNCFLNAPERAITKFGTAQSLIGVSQWTQKSNRVTPPMAS